MKRKILHLIPQLQFSDGIQSYVKTLCESYDENLYKISVITFYVKNNDIIIEELKKCNVNILVLRECLFERINNRYLKFFLKNIIIPYIFKFLSFKKSVTELQPDLVFAHGEDAEIICGFLPSSNCLVNVLHGESFFPKNICYKLVLNKLARKRFKFTLIVNKNLKRILDNKSKCFVVKAGIDIDKFYIKPDFNINGKGKIVIGNIGRISEEKNLKNLLRAYIKMAFIHKNLNLLFAGTGSEIDTLKKMVPDGLNKRVSFLGEVSEPQKFYKMIDIFVLTSNSEGGPITLLEAFAANRIVVASKVGIVTQILDDEVNGVLLKNTSVETLIKTLGGVVNNINHYRNISINNSKSIYLFSKEKFINNFYQVVENIYSKCINKVEES